MRLLAGSRKSYFRRWERTLAGGGGSSKGGGGSGGAAQEDADTLQSKQFARILHAISEGPIDGWKDPIFPLRNILLDGTPIENNDAPALRHDGSTTTGSQVFTVPVDTFPVFRNQNGVVKPFKSPWVGRWISCANLPFGATIASVEHERHCTLNVAATGSGSGLDWQLGGTLNHRGINFQFRTGTQNQTYMEGFPALEVTTGVGIRVLHNTPWSHAFTDVTLDAARIDIRIPRLTKQDTDDGDLHGSNVRLKIKVNGSVVIDDTVTGKASSPYIRTYKVEFAGITGPWTVSVERVTDDSQSLSLANETWVDSYTELIYGKLRHPNTALFGMRINAKNFGSIPTISYHIRGLLCKVPRNYDPETRTYSTSGPGTVNGVWDGTFWTKWTNNPAWCWYDMATNARYGLGNQLIEGNIDKFTLYTIGQYCDESVPNGFGGTEPRFTCNLYIQRHEDALKVMQDMAGIFRGMLCYINGTITPVQDAPTDPSTYRMFSPANVIDGVFNYSGVGLRARHNVAVVSWSDLSDNGKIKQEYIEDHEAIAKAGAINQMNMTGFGCTSRAQARRIGLWSIYAEKILTDTVTFSTALEGYFITPGKLIQIQDPFRAGAMLSGRIKSSSTNTHLFLDRTVTLQSGHTYTVALLNPSTGLLVAKSVTSGAGDWSDINCATFGFSPGPEADSVFQIADVGVVEPALFRVLGLVQKDEASIEITALQYNESLYDFVDFNHPLEEPPTSHLPPAGAPSPPLPPLLIETIEVIKPDHTIRQDIELSWNASLDPYLWRYAVKWRKNNGNWQQDVSVDVTSFRLNNITPGDFDFQIYAINTVNRWSATPLEVNDYHVDPPPTNVTGVTGLEIFGGNHYQNGRAIFQTRDCHFVWRAAAGTGPNIPFGQEGEGLQSGLPDGMARGFHVEIYNDDDKIWEDDAVASEYVFTWEKNKQAVEDFYGPGFGALRIFRIEVRVRFTDNTLSDPARLTVENPLPPPPQNVTTVQGNGYVAWQWDLPTAPDIDHFALYASQDPQDDNPGQVAEFHGTSGTYYTQPGAWYYWLGTVDSFGNVSANVPQGPPPGGVVQPPRFNPVPGSYQSAIHVAITEDTPGCTLQYSLVPLGRNPATWYVYGGPVYITENSTLYALATQDQPPFAYALNYGNYHVAANPPPGAPPNDYFSQAIRLNGSSGGPINGTTINATVEANEPAGRTNTVWYKWTTPATKVATIQLNSAQSKIDVYTGTSLLDLVAAANSTNGLARWNATAGVTYYICISKNTAQANFTLSWSLATTPTGPANNNFANAISLAGSSGTRSGTLIGATRETGEPTGENTVWYKWTPGAGNSSIDVGITNDYRIDIYTGSAVNALTPIANSSDGSVTWTSTAGQEYKIRIAKATQIGTFTLGWGFISAPPNDNFANAINLSGVSGGPVMGTTVGATVEIGETGATNTVWYNWTAPNSWDTYMNVNSQSKNCRIDVFTGSTLLGLTPVTYVKSDDGDGWIAFTATASTVYRIRISKRTGLNTSNFALQWAQITPPANDNFANAVALTGYAGGPQAGTTIGATHESGEPAGDNSVWYTWVGVTTGKWIGFWAGSDDMIIELYTGSAVNALTLQASSSNGILWFTGTTAGTTYRIRVRSAGLGQAFNLYWYTPIVSTPQFDPPSGFFDMPYPQRRQDVHIYTETASAELFITEALAPTVGRDPTVADYDVHIPRNSILRSYAEGSWDVRVLATRDGWLDSDVARATYLLTESLGPACATPTANPNGGLFESFPVNVVVACSDPSTAMIKYTIDGTIPSRNGPGTPVISGSTIQIPRPCYLKMVAYRRDREESRVVIIRFRLLGRLAPPVFRPGAGQYGSFPMNVDVYVPPQSGIQIRYTLDGSIPTETHGTLINSNTGTVSIPAPGTTLKAIAFGTGYITSVVTSAVYSGIITPPTLTPDTSLYDPGTDLTVSADVTPPSGVAVNARYTLDGSKPTRTTGTLLTSFPSNITVSGGYRELRIIAFAVDAKSGYNDSAVKLAIYDWVRVPQIT